MNRSTRQIIDLLKDKFNLEMSFKNVDKTYRYGKKWRPIINYLRNRYLKNISRIPIANKAYRLRVLQEATEEALTWYAKTVNQYGEIQEKKLGVLPQLINEARKEMEGEKPLIDVSTHITKIDIRNLKEKPQEELIDIVFRRNNGTVIKKR